MFPLPAHKPTPPAENLGATPPPTEGMALAAPEGTPPLPGDHELIGLDQPAAKRLLGPAAEQSDAPPATIWRYRSANCELDLFFYLDLKSGKMRTLHYAFKGESDDAAGRQDCLRSLVVARKS